jgi:uncharacterized membrane protein
VTTSPRSSRLLLTIAALLALVGVADAFYLTLVHLTGTIAWCGEGGTCADVLESAYATVGGVPIAAIGTLAYGSVFSLGILAIYGYRRARTLLAGLVAIMLAMTAWLLYVQAQLLHAFCPHCLLSAGLTATLTGCLALHWFLERRAAGAGFQ